tara:strand:- start:59 stop:1726 length:1668 start_codon:yes stop_codon:yes gene_type:complete
MNFWKGFINIQKAIYDINDLKIVAHSWNVEYDSLVKNIYGIDLLLSEKQVDFSVEYMPLINPVNKFERGVKRSNSTWKNVTPQTILGNVKSKTNAIKLLSQLNLSDDTQILSVRWDQGCTGSESVNKIIFDKSLDNKYHYLSYFSEIDEGYADMWFVSPYTIAKKFEQFENYTLDCLAGKNSYYSDFTKEGWPLAIKRNHDSNIVKRLKSIFTNRVLKKVKLNFFKKTFPALSNKISGFEQRIKTRLELPVLSGENSLTKDSKQTVIFPNYQALNIHAILKSFILNKHIREQTRFLDVNDFNQSHDGTMINPIDFSYVIYSHSSFSDCWRMSINQAKECLPKNCKKIYLLSDESQLTTDAFSCFENDRMIELITYGNEQKYTNRLVKAFNKMHQKYDFVYFVHEDMPLMSNVNKVYLNSLLHYMNNSKEFYIKLVDTNYVDDKQNHDSFPGLVKNFGGYSFSVQASLLKPDHLVSFLKNFNEDIYGLEQMCLESNFRFSAVKGVLKVGKYLLTNNHFPHVSTAISKGKWCTDEWPEQIKYLSNKYNIDLSIRGEC